MEGEAYEIEQIALDACRLESVVVYYDLKCFIHLKHKFNYIHVYKLLGTLPLRAPFHGRDLFKIYIKKLSNFSNTSPFS